MIKNERFYGIYNYRWQFYSEHFWNAYKIRSKLVPTFFKVLFRSDSILEWSKLSTIQIYNSTKKCSDSHYKIWENIYLREKNIQGCEKVWQQGFFFETNKLKIINNSSLYDIIFTSIAAILIFLNSNIGCVIRHKKGYFNDFSKMIATCHNNK